jgi:hypothetical protein
MKSESAKKRNVDLNENLAQSVCLDPMDAQLKAEQEIDQLAIPFDGFHSLFFAVARIYLATQLQSFEFEILDQHTTIDHSLS